MICAFPGSQGRRIVVAAPRPPGPPVEGSSAALGAPMRHPCTS